MNFKTATATLALMVSFSTAGHAITREEHQADGFKRDAQRQAQKDARNDKLMQKSQNVLAQVMVERPVSTWGPDVKEAFCRVQDKENFDMLVSRALGYEHGGANLDLKRAEQHRYYGERDIQRNVSYTYQDVVRKLNNGQIDKALAVEQVEKIFTNKKKEVKGAVAALTCP